MGYRSRRSSGLTLIEVLVAAGVFLVAATGILSSFSQCVELNQMGMRSTIAVQGVKNKVEEIKSSTFANIFTNYNNRTFTIPGLDGIGVIYVDTANTKLVEVKVVFCWRLADGRVAGEDTNLNGILNTGEDKNGNGQLDSYVQVITRIYG